MQSKVFAPAVSDDMELRDEQVVREHNSITVMDECIPSPDEIQSDETIVLPEIISMTEYIRRHYEEEIIRACKNQIFDLRLGVVYEGRYYQDVSGLGPIDYGEEELILTDGPTPREWGEPRAHSFDPNMQAFHHPHTNQVNSTMRMRTWKSEVHVICDTPYSMLPDTSASGPQALLLTLPENVLKASTTMSQFPMLSKNWSG